MTIRQIRHGGADYRNALALRHRILREPLGLVFSEAELEAESNDLHFAAFDSESRQLIACLVLSPGEDGTVKMRQVTVIESHRGHGVGRDLVRFSEGFASEHGWREIVLHARAPVVPFYLALGYAVDGQPFVEVTLPHRKMRKKI